LDFLDFFFSFLDFFFGLTLSSLESSESESESAFFSGLASLASTFLLTRTSFSSGFGAKILLFSSETKYLTHD